MALNHGHNARLHFIINGWVIIAYNSIQVKVIHAKRRGWEMDRFHSIKMDSIRKKILEWMKTQVIHWMRYFPTIMQSNMLYKEQLNSYQEFEQSIVIALSNNDRIFHRTFNDFKNSNTKCRACPIFLRNIERVIFAIW